MERLRISIINWTGDRANWGCQATSFGLLEDLKEAAAGKFELDFHFVPLGSKTTADRLVNKFFQPFLRRYLADPQPPESATKLFALLNTAIYRSHITQLEKADVVVFMAEGTMSGRGFFEGKRLLMLPHLASTKFKKPVISLNQTIFSKEADFLPLLRNVYSNFEFVAAREPASAEYASEIGLKGVELFPDSAFRTKSSGKPLETLLSQTPVAPVLCVTASGGYAKSYEREYIRLSFEFAKENGLQICGLFWQPPAIEAFQRIHAEIGGHAPVFPVPGANFEDVSCILEHAWGLIGGRYHTSIQAAAVHTPFVNLPSGTHKTKGLIQLLNYPLAERPFDDLLAVRNDLLSILRRREALVDDLKSAMKRISAIRQTAIDQLGLLLTELASRKTP